MLLSYYRRPLFLILLLYAGGIVLFRDFFIKPPPALPFALPRAGVLAEGRIAEYPVTVRGGTRFTLETDKIYGRPFRTGLMVYTRSAGGASYGDRVSLLADLEVPPGAEVPGSLDWAEYLHDRGITAQARAVEMEVTGRANFFILLARKFRYGAMGAFEAAMPAESAAIFGGVVLGEKRGVPPDLRTAFQNSGAMHLLVASGSNVGFVVAVVYFFCARLGLKRKYSGLAALLLAGFYVTAAGLDSPLVRAYLMFSAGLCAWLLKREAGAFHALTAACLLILVLSPRYIYDAGFQMSALAAYGLITGMALWGPYVKRGGLAGYAAGLFLMSFFAQLGLYPLLALYFHKVSVVSLVSNMVLVPASGVAMALGFMLAVFSWAGPVFKCLSFVAGSFMWAFIRTVRFFAGLPFSSISAASPSAWFIAGFSVLSFALLHAPLLGFRRPRLYAAAFAGVLIMSAGPLCRARSGAGGPAYGALLFGDSNTRSALVRAPSGALYLVNPGINGKKLAAAVFGRGSRTLEGVMLTSLEEKNYSGLGELAALVGVRNIFVPYGPRPEKLKRLLAGLEAGGIRVSRMWPGEAGPDVSCGWDGGLPGYSGAADIFSWNIGALTLTREGECVKTSEGAPVLTAVKGEVVRAGDI